MSSGPARRVSPKDIQMVQNLIERCLQLYMNQKEVVETLLAQAKIEPAFTELVWQKLEEENRDFFNAYYLRLTVKNQILQFNKLLEQQVQLMHQMSTSNSLPSANGNHMPQLHRNPTLFNPEHAPSSIKSESSHHMVDCRMHTAFNNLHPSVDLTTHSNRINRPPDMITSHGSNMCLMQSMNGGLMKSESEYSSCANQFVLPSDAIVSGHSFSSVESNPQAFNMPLLELDTSFGQLGHFPRNFSLSDLTADFAQNILETYSGSPFLNSHDRENQGENKRLDPSSEGLSCDDFGSD